MEMRPKVLAVLLHVSDFLENFMKMHILAAVALTAMTASAFADDYTIDSEYTIPSFKVKHLGVATQRGRFNHASGKVVLDFAAKKGSVDLTIDTTSLDMGSAGWNAHVSSEGLFNVAKFPTMSFKSDNLVFDGEKVVAAEGQFTLLGITKPLKVTVNSFKCTAATKERKALCAGDITTTLKRSEFGMTKYLKEVSDAIVIEVPVEAYRD
jgi:polyisoprenoid-binding protein YceI